MQELDKDFLIDRFQRFVYLLLKCKSLSKSFSYLSICDQNIHSGYNRRAYWIKVEIRDVRRQLEVWNLEFLTSSSYYPCSTDGKVHTAWNNSFISLRRATAARIQSPLGLIVCQVSTPHFRLPVDFKRRERFQLYTIY